MSVFSRNACLVGMATALAHAAPAAAQTSSSVYPNSHMRDIARKLEAKLMTGSNPTGILEEKLNDSTQVAVRTKSGRAEFHLHFADVFFVLSGEATLLSGGTIVNPQGTGEIRGDSITGGTRVSMHQGDLVYVPPATSHQVQINSRTAFLYVVVKIPRKE